MRVITNSKGGVGSNPDDAVYTAMDAANMPLAYSRLPERLLTDLRPIGLTVTTLAGVPGRESSFAFYPLTMLMLRPAFLVYEQNANQ